SAARCGRAVDRRGRTVTIWGVRCASERRVRLCSPLRVSPPKNPRTKSTSRVPASASSFVGRRAELGRLEGLFAAGARLVTLVGPPGTGKTRLALAHAEAADAQGRRVTFVELAAATTGEELLAAVARA